MKERKTLKKISRNCLLNILTPKVANSKNGEGILLNNAFTLVELLATIVLLSIIVLIATPIINNIISSSKENANLRSIEGYADAVRNEYYNQQLDGGIPKINDEFLSNIDTEGNEIKCNYVLYSTDYQVILDSCTIDNTDKKYCYAKGNHYACDNNEYLVMLSETPKGPNSFETDSWEVIAQAIKDGYTSKYKIGDTKKIEVSGYGTFTVRIANMSTPAECENGEFSQTACGFVIEFADIITELVMNSSGSNTGGYSQSELRDFINNDIYNALPNDLKNIIVDTKVVSSHGSVDSNNFTSIDKLYLLSTKEIWGENLTYDSSCDYTKQLDYYKNLGVTSTNFSEVIKNSSGTKYWWTRSASSNSAYNFYNVGSGGDYSNSSRGYSLFGVSPAFRIE